jgi:transcriptional accessory protein Tex/SPT6
MFAVGDTLDVWVTQIDAQRRRVTLTAVRPGAAKSAERGPRRPRPQRRSAAPVEKSGGPPRERKSFPQKPRRFEASKRVHKPPRPVTPITKEMAEGGI